MTRERMSRISAAACTAGLVVGLVLAAPTAAHAKSVTIDDGTGDVWTEAVDEETGEIVWVTDPVDNAELTRTVVKHTKKSISIAASYVSLVQDQGRLTRMHLLAGRATRPRR